MEMSVPMIPVIRLEVANTLTTPVHVMIIMFVPLRISVKTEAARDFPSAVMTGTAAQWIPVILPPDVCIPRYRAVNVTRTVTALTTMYALVPRPV
jgi:hypothetical protein